jgi:hypothetical protein
MKKTKRVTAVNLIVGDTVRLNGGTLALVCGEWEQVNGITLQLQAGRNWQEPVSFRCKPDKQFQIEFEYI